MQGFMPAFGTASERLIRKMLVLLKFNAAISASVNINRHRGSPSQLL